MSYLGDDALPPIKLIPFPTTGAESTTHAPRKPGRSARIQTSHDLRWIKVQEFLRSSGLSPNTRKVYERELKRFLNWTELHWQELRSRHIGQYKEYLMEQVETEQKQRLSKNSINTALTALKSFFNWLNLTYPEILNANPTVGVKFEKVPIPPAQSLTPEQVQQVWAALEFLGETQQRDTALVHILSHGLRAGEIVTLNVAAFDGRLLFLADTKTDEPRLVPLRRESCEVVKDYLQWRELQGEVLMSDRPLILSHHNGCRGERLSYHGIYFAVERIGELAGIPDLHPHQFRHSYATNLLLQGLDPSHAKRLTGHQSEKAFRRYTLRSEQEAAIAAYYRIIGEEPEEDF
ncbi:MAG: tyrosine-type recombinase/integrase [Chroococcidiopsidaceae cyanobacterium CP_BM_RX_35]|nr:tyrosine-type recombinase/integrase [Chroococcidiopsidaceae cyanobacterium CP_BM_RX_35]